MNNGNFFAELQQGLARRADRPFLTLADGAAISFGRIGALAAAIGSVLRQRGAHPGDRIAAQVGKSPEAVGLYLAALREGMVFVPMNPAYTQEETAGLLADAEPAVYICEPARAEAMKSRIDAAIAVETLDEAGGGSLMRSLGDNQRPASPVAARVAEDLGALLYTSGTTGKPKGAMLTHANLSTNAAALAALWEMTEADRLVHALPIFHIHGLFVALNTAMLAGAEVIFLPNFEVAAAREALRQATLMMGVPTFYTRLLADPDFGPADCARVRLFISGSAPLTPETFAAFEARTGQLILERYGMSEAGIIASNPLRGERLAGTVGFALPGVEVRISGNQSTKNGEPGEIEVRGPNVFTGYWRSPEKTREAFTPDGWFRTGDVGTLDPYGRLAIVGRAKDLVIVGGMNVYPAEVEAALNASPAVAECAVIGAPHADMGEGVIAILAPASGAPENPPLGADDLAGLVATLATFKRPRRYFWVDSLPRNLMGKVDKASLRRRFADAFRQASRR